MNLDPVQDLLDFSALHNESDCEPAHLIRWIANGHKLLLDVSTSGGSNRRDCLNCKAVREHLDNDYICLRCRVQGDHAIPWDEIDTNVSVHCPYHKMNPTKYERLVDLGQGDKFWTPPDCTTSTCWVDAEIGYEGLAYTCGHSNRRLDMATLGIPLFEEFPIRYYVYHQYFEGEYGGAGEADTEFGWIPDPVLILADCKQGR